MDKQAAINFATLQNQARQFLHNYKSNIVGGLAGSAIGGGLGALTTNTDDDPDAGAATKHRIGNALAGALAGGTIGAVAPTIANDFTPAKTLPPGESVVDKAVHAVPYGDKAKDLLNPNHPEEDTDAGHNIVLGRTVALGTGGGAAGGIIGRRMDIKDRTAAAEKQVAGWKATRDNMGKQLSPIAAKEQAAQAEQMASIAKSRAESELNHATATYQVGPEVDLAKTKFEAASAAHSAAQAELGKATAGAAHIPAGFAEQVEREGADALRGLEGGESAAVARAMKGVSSNKGLLGSLFGLLTGAGSSQFLAKYKPVTISPEAQAQQEAAAARAAQAQAHNLQ